MTIKEVSEKFDLSADTLRYYERVGLLPAVTRTSGGVSIETLIEYVRLFNMGAQTIPARKKLLLEQREQIVGRIQELNDVLSRLDWKLDGYEERMLKCEERLKNDENAETP